MLYACFIFARCLLERVNGVLDCKVKGLAERCDRSQKDGFEKRP